MRICSQMNSLTITPTVSCTYYCTYNHSQNSPGCGKVCMYVCMYPDGSLEPLELGLHLIDGHVDILYK